MRACVSWESSAERENINWVWWSRRASSQSHIIICCKCLSEVNNFALYVGLGRRTPGWENNMQNPFVLFQRADRFLFLWRTCGRRHRCLDFWTKKMLRIEIKEKENQERNKRLVEADSQNEKESPLSRGKILGYDLFWKWQYKNPARVKEISGYHHHCSSSVLERWKFV